MFDREQAKEEIKKLIEKYNRLVESGKLKSYNEEMTKKDFILPLFRALGWDVEDGEEVTAEEKISKGRVDYVKSGMSVLCHEMIPATKSAVVMTKDPITGENVIGIESTYGACEAIVSGRVTGDYFRVDKENGDILDSELGEKEESVIYSVFDSIHKNNIWWNKNNDMLRTNWSLNSSEIKKICDIALAVEKIYGHAQDMEVVFQNDELYVVQTRDITTI